MHFYCLIFGTNLCPYNFFQYFLDCFVSFFLKRRLFGHLHFLQVLQRFNLLHSLFMNESYVFFIFRAFILRCVVLFLAGEISCHLQVILTFSFCFSFTVKLLRSNLFLVFVRLCFFLSSGQRFLRIVCRCRDMLSLLDTVR
jgi:hypothetical protein